MVMQACSSNLVASVSTNWWRKLWKLNIPQKIKIFIWKDCYDWIPTRFNLRGRRIQVIDLCPWCNKSSETTIHALWECNKFKSARIHWIPNKVLIRGKYKSFFDFLLESSSSLDEVELELFCVIA
ncbi:hypothetical protein LWI28_013183 [Acer negundo]|uniref:Reverse transcriptase zinc-binding domain-containing protein n=1 Tax=Acer negundo TaxID=4023 RepID=A0AAD5NVM0_ACENE|nr:hypothetical protein LWI28_013183 [Acer negundo]